MAVGSFPLGRAQSQLSLCVGSGGVLAFPFHYEGEQTLKGLHFSLGEAGGLRQIVKSCQVKWDEVWVGVHAGKWVLQM